MADWSLSDDAEADIEAIEEYSLRNYGESQRASYLDALITAFDLIAEQPEMGAPRPDLGDGVRALTIAKHIVYWELHMGHVYILRVRHGHQQEPTPFR